MLSETAYMKLVWRLGQTDDPAKIREMMVTAVNPEISPSAWKTLPMTRLRRVLPRSWRHVRDGGQAATFLLFRMAEATSPPARRVGRRRGALRTALEVEFVEYCAGEIGL